MDIFDLIDGPETARMVFFVMRMTEKADDVSKFSLLNFPFCVLEPIFELDPLYIFKFASTLLVTQHEKLNPDLNEFDLHKGDIDKICVAILRESMYYIASAADQKAPPEYENALANALKSWIEEQKSDTKQKSEKTKKEDKPKNRLAFLLGKNFFD